MPTKSTTKTAPKRPRYAKSKDPIYNLTKPSELIRHAVDDLIKTEKQRDIYRINMDNWHKPNSHCSVCFAGAVMAQTYHTNPTKSLSPIEMSIDNRSRRRVASLNSLREGAIYAFVYRFFANDLSFAPRNFNVAEDAVKKTMSVFEPNKAHVIGAYRSAPAGFSVLSSPKNAKERTVFKKQMKDIATKLESVGL